MYLEKLILTYNNSSDFKERKRKKLKKKKKNHINKIQFKKTHYN